MDKSKRSQILKLSLIFSLFISTPLIPTMFRPLYLYFIFNLLIVALGVEAGLVSFLSKSNDRGKNHVNTTLANIQFNTSDNSNNNQESEEIVKPIALLEKYSSEKIVAEDVMVVSKVKKNQLTPSIFFIGNGENEPDDAIQEDDDNEMKEEKDLEVISGQDQLFTKAEMFIENFYNQLKLQRQDSWNRIHEFHQKAICS